MPAKPVKKDGRGGARPGAGRPPSDDPLVATSARVPLALLERLDKWASKNGGLTRSAAVTEAIRRLVS